VLLVVRSSDAMGATLRNGDGMKLLCGCCTVGRGAPWRVRQRSAVTALVLLAGLISAQPALASTLTGHVTAAGQPIAGAFVAATGASGHAGAVSDSGGAFSLTLPDGTYRLVANAPGFAAATADGVVVSGASSHDLALTASGAKLAPLPLFGGGGGAVAADRAAGVLYATGGNVGDLYRSVDWGGTWTQVTVARDDAANGLSKLANPGGVVTSGFPGEVAASLNHGSGVFYSTDYGVTWRQVANSAISSPNSLPILWGHAGSRSVLLMRTATNTYVADMTAANPSFVEMTAPYAPAGQAIAVGDGADQPWLATVDSSGHLSVYPLLAQTTAPEPAQTLAGFPVNPVAVAIGGASASSAPPAGVVVASTTQVTMTVKEPAEAKYPEPAAAAAISRCLPPPGGATGSAQVTPNAGGPYGAAWVDGCWVQDSGGTVEAQQLGGSSVAIDAGYDATKSSAGTDAVVLLGGAGGRGAPKLAATVGGFPVPVITPTVEAKPGTDPSSAGIAVNGITAANVKETTFGPAGVAQVASAMDAGGAASEDGGASFHLATYDFSWSVAWWQGASGSWLLYGLSGNPNLPESNTVTGFLNWTSSTPPVGGNLPGGGNVSGSSGPGLGLPAGPGIYPTVRDMAGVPGQDTAFMDLASGNAFNPSATAVVRRVSVGPGPSFSNLTPIGGGVITKPGKLAYCPSVGSASSLQDVLLVTANNESGGAIYRVTGATGPSPAVTKVADLPGIFGFGSPALRADCASGTVLAASGAPNAGLLKSTDGGQTFATVAITTRDVIRAIAMAPGNPESILVGDAAGYIQSSADGGQSWEVTNDPTTGENFAAPLNNSGGMWDLVAPPAGAATASSVRYATGLSLRDPPLARSAVLYPPLARSADLVAGAGEFAGNLSRNLVHSTTSSPVPSISTFKLTNTRFTVGAKATAIKARDAAKAKPRKPRTPRGSAFVYTLSVASTATIVIARQSAGRLVGKKCVAQTKRNARKKACKIYTIIQKRSLGRLVGKKCVAQTKRNARKKRCTIITPAGTLTRVSKAGSNKVAFSGRIGRTALARGTYRATITARIGSGANSNSRTAMFTIVRG